MGEWNVAVGAVEPYPYQEYYVSRIFTHPQYSSSSLANSIAILRLSPVVPLGQYPTISTGCLPSTFISGLRCWIAGWGSASFVSGSYASIQTHVDVPIIDQATCQTLLRSTRLGANFVLDPISFLCAGGESGKGKDVVLNCEIQSRAQKIN